SGRSDLLERYSATCLRRGGEGARFSWGVAPLFFLHPRPNAFYRQRPGGQPGYVARSRAAHGPPARDHSGAAGRPAGGEGWWSERAWSGWRSHARRRSAATTWWWRRRPPASAPASPRATVRSSTRGFIIRPGRGARTTARAGGARSTTSAPRTGSRTANAAS